MKALAKAQPPYGPYWLRGVLLGAALGAVGGLVESLLVTASGYNLALGFVLLVYLFDILAAALGGALVGLVFGGLYLLLGRLPARRAISLPAALKAAALLLPGGLIVVLAAWTVVQPRFPGTAGAAADAPAGEAGAKRPNLILISLDTLRADHLGVYGYRRPTSPTIDRLAGEGVRFERALSPSAWTLPAHATLFTALHPSQHGASQPTTVLPQELRTLAEILREEGYATAAFTGGGWVSREFGLAQGFDLFDDAAEQKLNLGFQPLWRLIDLPPFRQESSFAHLLDKAVDWLHRRGRHGRSFFLFIHTYEVHDYFYNEAGLAPYLEKLGFSYDAALESVVAGPHRPGNNLIQWMADADAQQLAYLEALYDAEIMFADELLAGLLAELRSLGLDRNTLVVVTSDHGEGFDPARKRLHHGGRLHEDQIRVPLILRLPGTIPAGAVRSEPAGLIDLMPTVLDLLQLPLPREAAGRSLGSSISGGRAAAPRPLFGEELGYRFDREGLRQAVEDDYRMVSGVFQGLKLILSPDTEELYDLGRDAQERDNLAGSRSAAAALLREQLLQFRQQNQPVYARRRPEEARERLSRDTEEKLKSLGYIQ